MTSETMILDDESAAGAPEGPEGVQILPSEIDLILTAQIIVAWAGERGEEKRLGWWRTDLVSEFGGEDLLKRLLPNTWRWAVLQSVREAARREDAELRQRGHDHIFSLFHFGFAVDEQIDDRLREFKGSGRPPEEALPGLVDGIGDSWDQQRFLEWVHHHGEAQTTVTSVGRLIQGPPPANFDLRLRSLVAGLSPLAEKYPLPHFRSAR